MRKQVINEIYEKLKGVNDWDAANIIINLLSKKGISDLMESIEWIEFAMRRFKEMNDEESEIEVLERVKEFREEIEFEIYITEYCGTV